MTLLKDFVLYRIISLLFNYLIIVLSMKESLPFKIVDYSEKSIAIFGNTILIKDQLKSLGGRFNRNLIYNSSTTPGWIFSKKHKETLEELINNGLSNNNQKSIEVSINTIISNHESALMSKMKLTNEATNILPYIVDYSEKSIAIFGNTILIKDQLKSLGGRFNRNLIYNSSTTPGWIFSKKHKETLEELINTIVSSIEEDTDDRTNLLNNQQNDIANHINFFATRKNVHNNDDDNEDDTYE